MSLQRRKPIARKPRKRKAPGTRCYGSSKCRRNAFDTYKDRRYCVTHLADVLTGDYVKARDGRCVRCGWEGPLDWAHVISRAYKAIRWSVGERVDDPWNNSVALCRGCHHWQGTHPLEGEDFFRSLGIDYDNLKYLAKHDAPADPLAVLDERGWPAPEEETG